MYIMDPFPYLVAHAGLALVTGKIDEAIKYFIILSGIDFQSNKTLGYIYMGRKDYNNAIKYFIEYSKKFDDREILYTIGEMVKMKDLNTAKIYYTRAANMNCTKSIFRLAGFVNVSDSAKLLVKCYCLTFSDNTINKRLMRVTALNKLATLNYIHNNIRQFVEIVEAMMKYKDFDYGEYEMTESFHRLYIVLAEFRGFVNLEVAINCCKFLVKQGEYEYLYFAGLVYCGLSFPCMSNCIDSCEKPCLRDNTFHCKKHCGGPPTSDEKSHFAKNIDYLKARECFESVDDNYLTDDEIKNKNKLLKRIKEIGM